SRGEGLAGVRTRGSRALAAQRTAAGAGPRVRMSRGEALVMRTVVRTPASAESGCQPGCLDRGPHSVRDPQHGGSVLLPEPTSIGFTGQTGQRYWVRRAN